MFLFWSEVKSPFPIFAGQKEGFVYLDTAATSQKPQVVIDAVEHFLTTSYANVHRGAHFLGDWATAAFEGVREKTKDFLGARDAREIIFTKNATESINLVAKSFLKPGMRVLTTVAEHNANLIPYLQMRAQGVEVDFLEIDSETKKLVIDEAKIEKADLFAVGHVSNVLGFVHPIKELCALAKKHGTRTMIDGCQAAPHLAINVQEIDCDFYAFSAHKMYGFAGVGLLYGRAELLEEMDCFLGGGEMVQAVSREGFTPQILPHKYEAGTPPMESVISLGAAIDFVQSGAFQEKKQEEQRLVSRLYQGLQSLPGVEIISHPHSLSLVTFVVPEKNHFDLSDALSDAGICIRVGTHCTHLLHKELGIKTSLRASLGIYNDAQDVKRFLEALESLLT